MKSRKFMFILLALVIVGALALPALAAVPDTPAQRGPGGNGNGGPDNGAAIHRYGFVDADGYGFVDADGDGVCDNCDGTGNGYGFVDADGDGICDNDGTGSRFGGRSR